MISFCEMILQIIIIEDLSVTEGGQILPGTNTMMCIVHERRTGLGTARSLRWPCLLCSERTPVLPRRNRTWFSGTFVGTARGRVRRSGVPAWLGADARAATAEQVLVLRYICWNGVPGQSARQFRLYQRVNFGRF